MLKRVVGALFVEWEWIYENLKENVKIDLYRPIDIYRFPSQQKDVKSSYFFTFVGMTKKEAKLYFNVAPEEDIEEAWEEHFFKLKHYFLVHAPIPKVWESKIQRMLRQYEAYLVLAEKKLEKFVDDKKRSVTSNFSEDFISTFHLFHQLRAQQKGKVMQSFTPRDLKRAIATWLYIEREYALYWACPKSEKIPEFVAQSKEPDPMELLSSLKETKKQLASSSIRILKENYDNLPKNVQLEVKRLTLLSKF